MTTWTRTAVTMGALWDVIQAHIDASPYPPSERQIAARLGVAPNALSNWKRLRRLPSPENLHKVAELVGTPYRVVLTAALTDTGYLESEVVADAAPMTTRRAPARRLPLEQATPERDHETPGTGPPG